MSEAEKRGALKVGCVVERKVQRVEDRNLREHRQASAHGVDLVLAVELHRLLLQARRVALVLVPERIDLRLERLHRLHRAHALHRQRVEQDLRDDGEEDDREPVIADVAIDPLHQQEDRHRQPRHRQQRLSAGPRLRDEEAAEIERALKTESPQALVFLRSGVHEEPAVPALPRRQVGRGLDRDGGAADGVGLVLRLAHLPVLGLRHEPEVAALRQQRSRVELAVEGDPRAFGVAPWDVAQRLEAVHAPL